MISLGRTQFSCYRYTHEGRRKVTLREYHNGFTRTVETVQADGTSEVVSHVEYAKTVPINNEYHAVMWHASPYVFPAPGSGPMKENRRTEEGAAGLFLSPRIRDVLQYGEHIYRAIVNTEHVAGISEELFKDVIASGKIRRFAELLVTSGKQVLYITDRDEYVILSFDALLSFELQMPYALKSGESVNPAVRMVLDETRS